ncbi:hypothetical protein PHYSODRAFT_338682 [Phytophthora sojae]|uniref:Uncharacterized protein n=1 Tax=Phytophthora sojae (strain P6497) TaxID=1094619 RepID=G5A2T9_PHYSP|nr:hypothetical protein PHYSODRAFT_338682 [Phytophthora sojae]EGZ09979.1 hypothetical protein PHYSODRAFT_338682 [Phytophthora sojae]|eukprot:XP_009534840.1 hypothetical protein PHYSODRAFT_338682 [Phytophthora sojae]
MGSTWSSGSFLLPHSRSALTSQLQIKDVLALCEDGDLLLTREKLADSALRVGVEFVVARDIQRMQRGQFPSQRVTSLPRTLRYVSSVWCWLIEANSLCSPISVDQLLLRHEGALRVVAVNANGLELVPFEERVASKLPHIHDRYAIRRLRYDARSESLSSALRDLALQIASVAPISWHSLLFPDAAVKISPRSPRSPRQQPVDHNAVVNALKVLPPLLRQLLRRTLEKLKRESPLSDAQPTEHNNLDASKPENQATAAEFRIAFETLGVAEFTSRLSAAFVAAVYEHVQLLDPITCGTRNEPLAPAAFWSASNDSVRIALNPPTALGLEMALTRPN